MRKAVGGFALAIAGWALVMLSATLGLELEETALVGVCAGAVAALVPHRGPARRLVALAVGIVLCLVGFGVRAALLPDTSSGRAVFVGVVILLCVLVALVTRDRLPLWGLLLGAGAFGGTYETVYSLAPPELPTTSIDTLTSLVVCVALGFAVALFAAPDDAIATPRPPREEHPDETPADADAQMETSK